LTLLPSLVWRGLWWDKGRELGEGDLLRDQGGRGEESRVNPSYL